MVSILFSIGPLSLSGHALITICFFEVVAVEWNTREEEKGVAKSLLFPEAWSS
jgi:hypothetical protein